MQSFHLDSNIPDMKNRPQFPLLITAFMVVTALGMVGCSTPVRLLDFRAPSDSLSVNQTGTFSASINADASQPVATTWNFGDNATAQGTSASHSFSKPGDYTVRFTASNKKNVVDTTAVVRVFIPPVPAQITSVSADNMSPDTHSSVRFQANVRGDSPVTYNWNFGDGSTSTSSSPTHTFANPGSYTVSLNASNRAGKDSRTMTLNVSLYEAAICREITEMNAAFFGRNSSVLSDEAKAALQDNLEILNECPNMSVRVETFSAPGERHAQQLSEDRARAIEQFYAENGVAASRISATGMGRVKGVTSKKEGTSQYRRGDVIPVR